jgi:hypothetical protein
VAFTFAGLDVARARVTVPRYGVPVGEVEPVDPRAVPVGVRTTLVLSDLSLAVTPRHGGPYAGRAPYGVFGGADGWGTASVAAKGYRNDGGVWLRKVIGELAAAAGETLDAASLSAADRPLGAAWMRGAGGAGELLRETVGRAWWVGADGATRLGARPVAPVAPSVRFVVEDYRAAGKWARLSSPTDAVAAFLPGATFTAPEVSGVFTVEELVVSVEAGAVRLEVLGS